ncbi:MAG: RimK/LysX family protein [Candidatus Woesearchaeota archaeon]
MTFAGDPEYDDCAVIGFVEKVSCLTEEGERIVDARIDTGATKSSIDASLVDELKIGPVVGERIIRNAHGSERRKMVRVKIRIAGKTITAKFTIANRSRLRYPMLIGRNVLRKGFLIDPNKKTNAKPKEQTELSQHFDEMK